MSGRTIASYARQIRPLLKPGVFEPALSRLWWLPAHLLLIGVAWCALSRHWLPLLAAPAVSLIVGASFAGLTFLGHEALHGAVVRNMRARHLVGWVGFLPFVVSPRLWLAWHNRVHHGSTQHAGKDPDAYPTLAEYRDSRAVRFATWIAPGLGRVRGFLTPLVGFSVQSVHMLLVARRRGYLSSREHRLAIAETALGVALWSVLAAVLGGVTFIFGFALPLVVANAIVMGFILTNHSLSPLTGANDPLANSLTVTTPRCVQWLTLGFGFHVEHHLFPAMSARHAPDVRRVLLQCWPDQYQSMSLVRATVALHATPRVYKDPATLVDPSTGREWRALAPRPAFSTASQ